MPPHTPCPSSRTDIRTERQHYKGKQPARWGDGGEAALTVRIVDAKDVQQKKKPSGLKRMHCGWDALHQIQQRNSTTSVFVVSNIHTDAQTYWATLVAVLQCSSGMARMKGLLGMLH